MAEIGRINSLKVIKTAPQGVYLQGGWLGEVLLPTRWVPEGCQIGDQLDVFIYLDSEDRYIATTQTPLVQVGEAASLKVADVNDFGAFLDWGMPKQLLVPFNQQQVAMQKGKSYVVYVYTDDRTHRIAASSKLNKFIAHRSEGFKNGQSVKLLITDKTDIGYSAIVENRSWGVLFYSDVNHPLHIGQTVPGFIKRVRDDGKIDLSLLAPGYAKVEGIGAKVLAQLKKQNGYLPISDRSDPELIKKQFGVSKRTYKMAIGGLFKQKLITIEEDGIRITEKGNNA